MNGCQDEVRETIAAWGSSSPNGIKQLYLLREKYILERKRYVQENTVFEEKRKSLQTVKYIGYKKGRITILCFKIPPNPFLDASIFCSPTTSASHCPAVTPGREPSPTPV
jgi:hypothetical protein